VQPEDSDGLSPTIEVEYADHLYTGVLLDGGSGVNILATSELRRLVRPQLEPAPFQACMVNHSLVQPIGILRNQLICIHGTPFKISFIVLELRPTEEEAYTMLLGRPWFKQAKLCHDSHKGIITIKKRKTEQHIVLPKVVHVALSMKSLCVQTFSLASEVSDMEEFAFLEVNPSILPIFDISVPDIVKQYTPQAFESRQSKILVTHQMTKRMRKEAQHNQQKQ
jgi:hypothetical protein